MEMALAVSSSRGALGLVTGSWAGNTEAAILSIAGFLPITSISL